MKAATNGGPLTAMKNNDTYKLPDILERADRRDGIQVPDGYFETLADRISAKLPEMEWERESAEEPKRTLWQRVRPYAYLAAMFAGVWLMMQMFGLGAGSATGLSIDSRPALAQALQDQQFVDEYLYDTAPGLTDDTDLMDNLYASGFDPTESSAR